MMAAGLTISQVAKKCGVTTRTIENRIRANTFASHDYRTGLKGWRFWRPETVAEYLEAIKNHEKE